MPWSVAIGSIPSRQDPQTLHASSFAQASESESSHVPYQWSAIICGPPVIRKYFVTWVT